VVQVSAPQQPISASQLLTISPIGVTGFTITPTTVVGGNTVSATVTLSGIAPSGGVSVTLAAAAVPGTNSSASAVALPSKVTVLAGTTSLTFNTIQTHVVSSTNTLAITASIGTSSQTATLTITGVTGGTFGEGIQFFSIPYAYTDLLSNIFLTPPTNGLIDLYNPAAFSYTPLGSGSTVATIQPGLGYWASFPSGGDALLYLGTPASTTVVTTINLSQGWNSIGDPYTTAINIADLNFSSTKYTFAQAVSANYNLISPTLYYYLKSSASSGAYSPVTTGSQLQPGVGYWIYSYFNTTLNYPLPIATPTSTTTVTTTTPVNTSSYGAFKWHRNSGNK
jgi:hypothetical protein